MRFVATRSISAAISFFVLSLAAPPARAGDEELGNRLFAEARTLLDEGKVDAGCDKFADSVRANLAVGALAQLGRCRQKQGRRVEALAHFRQALELAEKLKDDRAEATRALVAELAQLLPHVRVAFDVPLPQATVTLDGTKLRPHELGTDLPLEPGVHELVVTAAGLSPWSKRLSLVERGGRTEVRVPELRPAPPPVPPAAPSAPAQEFGVPPAEPPDGEGMPALEIAGIVSTALGGALVVGGLGLGATVLSDERSAQDRCVNDRCPADAFDLVERARAKALATDVLFAVGGAAAVAGVVLIAVAEIGGASETAALVPWVAPGAAGASVGGVW